MSRRGPRLVVLGLLLLAGGLAAAPGAAYHKVPQTSPVGMARLLAAPTPTPAVTPAPAPTTGSALTLDRFVIGFGLVVVGTFGAALSIAALRRLRRPDGRVNSE